MHTKLTIDDMQKLASKKGGLCLSKKFIDSHHNLKWQCAEGHIWEASPTSVKHNSSWCPHCANNFPQTIKQMQELAHSRGGKCLSKDYVNSHTKLKWECAKGHIWKAKPVEVKGGTWCPYCAGKAPLTIEDMQQLAVERGGKCLSKKYIDAQSKHKWQCAGGHIWEAKSSGVRNSNSWCPHCAKLFPLTIEEMHKLAAKHRGKCLSNKYVNALTKLKWQCAEGHVWEAAPASIKGGRWCPSCVFKYVQENLCREIFQIILKKKFPKVKHKWLLNNRGNNMELDGYNKELGIAFEYHGKQHYSYSSFFHNKNKKELISRKEDDATKRLLCNQNKVKLIEIPHTIRTSDLYNYIIRKCDDFKIQIPPHKKIDVLNLQLSYFAKDLMELDKLAQKRGGLLVSKTYLGSSFKHKWQCTEGHIWEATPTSIKRGSWCSRCAKLFPLTIEEMQELASERGGKCLSKKYINALTKLTWECVRGHTWEAVPASIKRGVWCPHCSKKARLTIEEMQKLAIKRGGKCLSEKYVNTHSKLKWQCAKGHVWEAIPANVKHGAWCQICARDRKK